MTLLNQKASAFSAERSASSDRLSPSVEQRSSERKSVANRAVATTEDGIVESRSNERQLTQWLTAREAAVRMRVSVKTIYAEVSAGRLRAARVGGRRALRFRAEWITSASPRQRVGTRQAVSKPVNCVRRTCLAFAHFRGELTMDSISDLRRSRASEPVRNALDALDGVQESGSGWSARCPAHDDYNPSLSVAEGDDGRVLLVPSRGLRH